MIHFTYILRILATTTYGLPRLKGTPHSYAPQSFAVTNAELTYLDFNWNTIIAIVPGYKEDPRNIDSPIIPGSPPGTRINSDRNIPVGESLFHLHSS